MAPVQGNWGDLQGYWENSSDLKGSKSYVGNINALGYFFEFMSYSYWVAIIYFSLLVVVIKHSYILCFIASLWVLF